MQFGQVPIQFVPEPVVNDTRALTVEAEEQQVIAPQRPGEAPAPVLVEEIDAGTWGMWAAIAGLLVFAWVMSNPRGR